MQESFNVRQIIKASTVGCSGVTENEIDTWTSEVEAYFALQPDQTEILDDNLAANAARGEVFALGRFDRWRCVRCVAANMALAAAISAAIVAFGPASPGVVPYIAAQFGISEVVAAAAVGGLSGAALAKKLCGNVC